MQDYGFGSHYDPEATAAGIDASRRVGWARYYRQVEDTEVALRHNVTLLRYLARFTIRVVRSEAVRVFDPELHEEARRVLLAISYRARGRAIINEAERDLGNDGGSRP